MALAQLTFVVETDQDPGELATQVEKLLAQYGEVREQTAGAAQDTRTFYVYGVVKGDPTTRVAEPVQATDPADAEAKFQALAPAGTEYSIAATIPVGAPGDTVPSPPDQLVDTTKGNTLEPAPEPVPKEPAPTPAPTGTK